MDWNELRSDWQARRDDAPVGLELRPDAREQLWRRVRFRDGVETLVALLMLPVFGFAAVRLAQAGWWPAALFAAGLCVAILYIPIRLWRARQRIPVPDPGAPVLEFLRAEREALAVQADMLRSVARWYSGPICVGVIGFFVSLNGFTLPSLLYTLFVIGLFAWIEWANRAAVRMRFEPELDAIDRQISSLRQES
jgi:Flp pilus assembly protein TadB